MPLDRFINYSSSVKSQFETFNKPFCSFYFYRTIVLGIVKWMKMINKPVRVQFF